MTVFELYKSCRAELEGAGIENAENEARFIVQKSLECDETAFLLSKNASAEPHVIDRAVSMTRRRLKKEPLQYILGEWDFFGYTFKVGEGVLAPRPETEELCSLVLERIKDTEKKLSVFDLCSGTGCIGISLKKTRPDLDVYLVEYSDEALGYLSENRMRLGVARSVPAIKGDVLLGYEAFGFLPAPDVIVSNPPYIKSTELPSLQTEVTREPKMALDGGEDGLDFYRALAQKWLPFLKSGGFIAVECGEDQAEAVAALFSKLADSISIIKDFNGIDRFVIAGKD